MHLVAFVSLVLIWIAWLLPFFIGNRRRRGQRREVTVKAARWGVVLQGISFGIVWGSQYQFWLSPLSPWRFSLSMVLGLLSTVSAWSAVANLGRQWRVDAGLNPDHELVRSGPYRFVRHPIYASMLGMYLAAGLLLSTWPVFLICLAMFILGTEIRVRIEDALLASRFQGEFTAFKSSVSAYIPFIR